MNEAPTNVPSPASSVAIEAVDLEKAYGAGLGALLSPRAVRAQDPALAGVTFSLPVGAALAVLGRNGAGKSTLLRLLAGTALPTRGSLRICGRVGLLLDLGSGLVDEMTGAENVRASLRLLGLGGRDLATAEQFVAGFADLGSFLLETVRVYSQGMRLRLAYAIAIATQPEVLITDEVLAVGDESFQRKCSRHMVDFVEGGGTLVLATHNLYLAEKLCGTALWLERGRERAVGPAGEVAKAYRDSLAGGWSEPRRSAVRAEQSSIPAGGRALAVLSGASVTTGGHVRMRFEDPWEISVPFAAEKSAAVREVEIDRPDGAVVARIPVDGWRGGVLTIPAGSILPGRYRLRLSDPSTSAAQETLWVECVGARREIGSVLLRHRWHRTSSKAAPEALWGS